MLNNKYMFNFMVERLKGNAITYVYTVSLKRISSDERLFRRTELQDF
jgi:hypothetical protein